MSGGAAGSASGNVPVLEIVRAGMCTTVQDLGRPGLGRLGVGPSGPMDPWAHRVANRLAGNPEQAAALELTGPGAELRFLVDTVFALAGGDLGARLDDRPVPALAVARAAAGSRLRFVARTVGARVSLAVAGGLQGQPVLGSAATDLGAGLGANRGRPLRAGHQLSGLARSPASSRPPPEPSATVRAALQALLLPAAVAAASADTAGLATELRFVPEPQGGVPVEAQAMFASRPFVLSPRSGRTGYRFEGTPLPTHPDPERLSEPTAPHAIQLPADGLPILLMADRNTTGGYPRLGHLCAADVGRAAQLWPGEQVQFVPVPAARAVALVREAAGLLQSLLERLAT